MLPLHMAWPVHSRITQAGVTYTNLHKINPEKIPAKMGKMLSRLQSLLRSQLLPITSGRISHSFRGCRQVGFLCINGRPIPMHILTTLNGLRKIQSWEVDILVMIQGEPGEGMASSYSHSLLYMCMKFPKIKKNYQ